MPRVDCDLLCSQLGQQFGVFPEMEEIVDGYIQFCTDISENELESFTDQHGYSGGWSQCEDGAYSVLLVNI